MRTIIYVDGFNFYYRALKHSKYKWVDLQRLAQSLLKPENEIVKIRYFTARVTGDRDRDAPRRQQLYLKALKTIPELKIHLGQFRAKTITRPLVSPIRGFPKYVEVYDTEEKGSDVNLATYLLHDGWGNKYDTAIVVSKDTDLTEPIRLVKDELRKVVGIICPDAQLPVKLRNSCNFVRHVTGSRLKAAQFDNPLFEPSGAEIYAPTEWVE